MRHARFERCGREPRGLELGIRHGSRRLVHCGTAGAAGRTRRGRLGTQASRSPRGGRPPARAREAPQRTGCVGQRARPSAECDGSLGRGGRGRTSPGPASHVTAWLQVVSSRGRCASDAADCSQLRSSNSLPCCSRKRLAGTIRRIHLEGDGAAVAAAAMPAEVLQVQWPARLRDEPKCDRTEQYESGEFHLRILLARPMDALRIGGNCPHAGVSGR